MWCKELENQLGVVEALNLYVFSHIVNGRPPRSIGGWVHVHLEVHRLNPVETLFTVA